MGKPVGFEGVDLPLGPNEVLERVPSTPVTRNHVIEIAPVPADAFAGVLADAAIALEDRLARKTRDANRHFGELRGDHDRRNANAELRGGDHKIEFTDRQLHNNWTSFTNVRF